MQILYAVIATVGVLIVGGLFMLGIDISSEAPTEDYQRAERYVQEFPDLKGTVQKMLADGKLTLWEVDELIGQRNDLVREHNKRVREGVKRDLLAKP